MIGLSASPSFAAVLAGAKCSKIGTKVVVGNKTHTCIKSGMKKVWSKGVLKKEIKPIQSKPVTLTWENAATNASQMITDIWNNAQSKKIDPNQVITDRSIISTQNASFGQTDFVKTLNEAETYFSWTISSMKYRVLHYSRSDLALAQDKYREFYGSNGALPSCSIYCFGGNAQKTDSNWGHINLSLDIEELPEIYRDKSNNYNHLLTHEFVHLVQLHQTKNRSLGIVPLWFTEGGANFFATLIRSGSSKEFDVNSSTASFLFGVDDPSQVLSILNNPGQPQFVGREQNYGFWATEALVGIYGAEKVVRLYGAASEAENFADAFKTVFGDPWELVKPKLAATVSALSIQHTLNQYLPR
jgi:hypothetical protein